MASSRSVLIFFASTTSVRSMISRASGEFGLSPGATKTIYSLLKSVAVVLFDGPIDQAGPDLAPIDQDPAVQRLAEAARQVLAEREPVGALAELQTALEPFGS